VKVEFDEKKRWLTMERGLVKVFCNMGDAPVEFANAERVALLLASRVDVVAADGKVILPANTLAIFSGERV
jgi:maltooligosyltrehalose trehalohydrolase